VGERGPSEGVKETLRETLQKILKDYARERGFALPDDFQVELEISRDPSHGDLTTPTAFRLARWAKEKPSQIAGDLLRLLEKEMKRGSTQKLITRSEVAGGGFINFFLPSAQLAEILLEIHKKDLNYGRSDFGQGKPVIVEFVSANPTGPLTIAHGRQAAIGDALARILIATGFKVTREYYVNDTGHQIDLLGESLFARYQELLGKEVSVPEEGYQGAYLVEVAQRLKQEKGGSLLKKDRTEALGECREFAVSDILAGIREDLKAIDVHFDSYFSENELRQKKKVEKAVELLQKKGLVREEGGALWFSSTRFGDDKDRVLRKQTGDYTYLAPDIAYHLTKFERGFKMLVNLWGPDHHGYIPRLKAACQALDHDPAALKILIVQLVTLYRKGEPVRMSTRSGEFVTLRELFEEVGVDAARFFFILRRIESHLDFDLDLAKKQSDENPVYYLQYAHARTASILKFAKRTIDERAPLERLCAPEETELMKKLLEFPRILTQAAQSLEPYRVVEYLRELAAHFHKFYALHRVVTEDEELTAARLLLADGVRRVLRNGLGVLGISHPESM